MSKASEQAGSAADRVPVLEDEPAPTRFFVGAPDQYVANPAWWAKVAFLAVAMLNIAWFETRLGKPMLLLPGDVDTPLSFKVAGAVSIASWALVLYWGRMLPFIGNAF